MNYVTPARHGRSAIGLSPDAVEWRYVHRDDVKTYERNGWIRSRGETRNPYFVLMIWDKAHGN